MSTEETPTGRRRPKRELKMTPGQIRNRARRRQGKVNEEMENYFTHVAKKPIEEWDLEELARGRPRARDGTWKGLTPQWLTPAITREAKRRLMDHTFGGLAQHVDKAIVVIADMMTSTDVDEMGRPIVDARTKLAAAQFVIENVIGKPKAVVEVEATDLVRTFIASALVLDDGDPAHPVIDGQFRNDDEEEEEDDDDTDG